MVSVAEDGETILESKERLFASSLPVYQQRYNAVTDYVNQTGARRVVDIGCAEGSLMVNVKELCPCVQELSGVDLDGSLVDRSRERFRPLAYAYMHRRTDPLEIGGYCGSISTPDRRFVDVDLISMVEIIEHLYDDTLARVPEAIFGRLRPRAAIVTTPNSDFNVLFPDMGIGADGQPRFRHWDHKFEWSRAEFETWATGVASTYGYGVRFSGVGAGLPGTEHLGCCSQMATFERIADEVEFAAHAPTADDDDDAASAVPAQAEFGEFEQRWSVSWPYTPRPNQIYTAVSAKAYRLGREAHDIREGLDQGESCDYYGGEESVSCSHGDITPILLDNVDPDLPCDCGYEASMSASSCAFGADSVGGNVDLQLGAPGPSATVEPPSSSSSEQKDTVRRCVPHVCLNRISAWDIPLHCFQACLTYDLSRLECRIDDVLEVLEHPPATPSANPATIVLSYTPPVLSADRKSVIYPNVLLRNSADEESDGSLASHGADNSGEPSDDFEGTWGGEFYSYSSDWCDDGEAAGTETTETTAPT
eukprot:scpid48909/ scgid17227/ Small RNA 2&apos; HEN1 methyltransferase homolog 1